MKISASFGSARYLGCVVIVSGALLEDLPGSRRLSQRRSPNQFVVNRMIQGEFGV